MLVSVTIPTYNAADYLREAIQSVLAQTIQADEIIVADDGSTDHTREVCASFGDKIKYLYQENDGIGGGGARSLANRTAQGEWIAMLDHDDRWLPDKLEKQLNALRTYPDAEAVFTPARVIDENGDHQPDADVEKEPSGEVYELSAEEGYHLQLKRPYYCPSSAVVRRSLLLQHDQKDLTQVGVGDWAMWLGITRKYPVAVVDEYLTEYRVFSSQYVTDKMRLGLALEVTLDQQAALLHPKCADCRRSFRQGQAFIAQVKAVGARAYLDEYHSIARQGEMSRSLPLLWNALRAAPREVLNPRRAMSIVKTNMIATLKIAGGR
jgi:Glycosyl transferase family 2